MKMSILRITGTDQDGNVVSEEIHVPVYNLFERTWFALKRCLRIGRWPIVNSVVVEKSDESRSRFSG